MIVELSNILERVNALYGDDITDEGLSLIEDITDTFNAANENGNSADVEAAVGEAVAATEKKWREKYRARFFSNNGETPDNDNDDYEDVDDNENKTKSFEELFSEEE